MASDFFISFGTDADKLVKTVDEHLSKVEARIKRFQDYLKKVDLTPPRPTTAATRDPEPEPSTVTTTETRRAKEPVDPRAQGLPDVSAIVSAQMEEIQRAFVASLTQMQRAVIERAPGGSHAAGTRQEEAVPTQATAAVETSFTSLASAADVAAVALQRLAAISTDAPAGTAPEAPGGLTADQIKEGQRLAEAAELAESALKDMASDANTTDDQLEEMRVALESAKAEVQRFDEEHAKAGVAARDLANVDVDAIRAVQARAETDRALADQNVKTADQVRAEQAKDNAAKKKVRDATEEEAAARRERAQRIRSALEPALEARQRTEAEQHAQTLLHAREPTGDVEASLRMRGGTYRPNVRGGLSETGQPGISAAADIERAPSIDELFPAAINEQLARLNAEQIIQLREMGAAIEAAGGDISEFRSQGVDRLQQATELTREQIVRFAQALHNISQARPGQARTSSVTVLPEKARSARPEFAGLPPEEVEAAYQTETAYRQRVEMQDIIAARGLREMEASPHEMMEVAEQERGGAAAQRILELIETMDRLELATLEAKTSLDAEEIALKENIEFRQAAIDAIRRQTAAEREIPGGYGSKARTDRQIFGEFGSVEEALRGISGTKIQGGELRSFLSEFSEGLLPKLDPEMYRAAPGQDTPEFRREIEDFNRQRKEAIQGLQGLAKTEDVEERERISAEFEQRVAQLKERKAELESKQIASHEEMLKHLTGHLDSAQRAGRSKETIAHLDELIADVTKQLASMLQRQLTHASQYQFGARVPVQEVGGEIRPHPERIGEQFQTKLQRPMSQVQTAFEQFEVAAQKAQEIEGLEAKQAGLKERLRGTGPYRTTEEAERLEETQFGLEDFGKHGDSIREALDKVAAEISIAQQGLSAARTRGAEILGNVEGGGSIRGQFAVLDKFMQTVQDPSFARMPEELRQSVADNLAQTVERAGTTQAREAAAVIRQAPTGAWAADPSDPTAQVIEQRRQQLARSVLQETMQGYEGVRYSQRQLEGVDVVQGRAGQISLTSEATQIVKSAVGEAFPRVQQELFGRLIDEGRIPTAELAETQPAQFKQASEEAQARLEQAQARAREGAPEDTKLISVLNNLNAAINKLVACCERMGQVEKAVREPGAAVSRKTAPTAEVPPPETIEAGAYSYVKGGLPTSPSQRLSQLSPELQQKTAGVLGGLLEDIDANGHAVIQARAGELGEEWTKGVQSVVSDRVLSMQRTSESEIRFEPGPEYQARPGAAVTPQMRWQQWLQTAQDVPLTGVGPAPTTPAGEAASILAKQGTAGIEAAAQKLGVTVEQLSGAIGRWVQGGGMLSREGGGGPGEEALRRMATEAGGQAPLLYRRGAAAKGIQPGDIISSRELTGGAGDFASFTEQLSTVMRGFSGDVVRLAPGARGVPLGEAGAHQAEWLASGQFRVKSVEELPGEEAAGRRIITLEPLHRELEQVEEAAGRASGRIGQLDDAIDELAEGSPVQREGEKQPHVRQAEWERQQYAMERMATYSELRGERGGYALTPPEVGRLVEQDVAEKFGVEVDPEQSKVLQEQVQLTRDKAKADAALSRAEQEAAAGTNVLTDAQFRANEAMKILSTQTRQQITALQELRRAPQAVQQTPEFQERLRRQEAQTYTAVESELQGAATGTRVHGSVIADMLEIPPERHSEVVQNARVTASAQTQAVVGEMNTLKRAAHELFGRNGFISRMVNSTGTFIVRQFSAMLVFGTINALQQLGKQALETEQTFVRVEDALAATGRSAEGYQAKLQDIAVETNVSVNDTYSVMSNLVGVFEDAQDALDATRIVNSLELISQGALNAREGYKSVSAVAGAFFEQFQEAGMDAREANEFIADMAVRIQDLTSVNIEDTLEGLGRLGEVARQMGVDAELMASSLALVSKATQQTGQAASEQLGRVFARLQDVEVQNMLVEMGITDQAVIDARDFQTVILELFEAFPDLGAGDQGQIARALGGTREFTAAIGLLRQGTTALEVYGEVQDSSGARAERHAEILATLQGQIGQLGKQVQVLSQNLLQLGLFDWIGLVVGGMKLLLAPINEILQAFNKLTEISWVADHAAQIGILILQFRLLRRLIRGTAAEGILSGIGAAAAGHFRGAGAAGAGMAGRGFAAGVAPRGQIRTAAPPPAGHTIYPMHPPGAAPSRAGAYPGGRLPGHLEPSYHPGSGYYPIAGGPFRDPATGRYSKPRPVQATRSFRGAQVNLLQPRGVSTAQRAAAARASYGTGVLGRTAGAMASGGVRLRAAAATRYQSVLSRVNKSFTRAAPTLSKVASGMGRALPYLIGVGFAFEMLTRKGSTLIDTLEELAPDKERPEDVEPERTSKEMRSDKIRKAYEESLEFRGVSGFGSFAQDILGELFSTSSDSVLPGGMSPLDAVFGELRPEFLESTEGIEQELHALAREEDPTKKTFERLAELQDKLGSRELLDEAGHTKAQAAAALLRIDVLEGIAADANDNLVLAQLGLQNVIDLTIADMTAFQEIFGFLEGFSDKILQEAESAVSLLIEHAKIGEGTGLKGTLERTFSGKLSDEQSAREQLAASERILKDAEIEMKQAYHPDQKNKERQQQATERLKAALQQYSKDMEELVNILVERPKILSEAAEYAGDPERAAQELYRAGENLLVLALDMAPGNERLQAELEAKRMMNEARELLISGELRAMDLLIAQTDDPVVQATEELRKAETQLAAAKTWASAEQLHEYQIAVESARKGLRDVMEGEADAISNAAMAIERDPLARAQTEMENAAANVHRQMGRGEAAYTEAVSTLIQTQQAYEELLNSIVSSQYALAEAVAGAAGLDVEVALIRLEEARRLLARGEEQGVGEEELNQLRADVVSAEAAARDARFQEMTSDIDFLLQMERISSSAAIGMLEDMLTKTDLTEKQRRELLLKIKGLEDDISSQLAAGFNIPTEIDLPTAYEVRRSLAESGMRVDLGAYETPLVEDTLGELAGLAEDSMGEIVNTIAERFGEIPGITSDAYGDMAEEARAGAQETVRVTQEELSRGTSLMEGITDRYPEIQQSAWAEARRAAEAAVGSVNEAISGSLSSGVDSVIGIVSGYAQALVEGLNPILEAIGRPPITLGGGNIGSHRGGGGGVQEYAEGGLNIPGVERGEQQATIKGPNKVVQWAEPETGGEAFIPLSPAKRQRSLAIWERTGELLGALNRNSDERLSFAQGGFREVDPVDDIPVDQVRHWLNQVEGADHTGGGYSSTGFGGVKPHVAMAGDYIAERFGVRDIGGVGQRPGPSDHPLGLALDFMVYDEKGKGDAIARYLADNAGHFGIKYLIWYEQMNSGSGWRNYTRYDAFPENDTLQHRDHVHASFDRLLGRLGAAPQTQDDSEGGFSQAGFRGIPGLELPQIPDTPEGLLGDVARLLMEQIELAILSFGGEQGLHEVSSDASTEELKNLARQMLAQRGWSAYWPAFDKLVQGESSWNPLAQNPTSTAFGLGQFLDATWATVGGTKTTDPSLQLEYMMRYIDGRYGNPENAYRTWQSRSPHWYASGGIFDEPNVIGVGESGPEAVIPLNQAGVDFLSRLMNMQQPLPSNDVMASAKALAREFRVDQSTTNSPTQVVNATVENSFSFTVTSEAQAQEIARAVSRSIEQSLSRSVSSFQTTPHLVGI